MEPRYAKLIYIVIYIFRVSLISTELRRMNYCGSSSDDLVIVSVFILHIDRLC